MFNRAASAAVRREDKVKPEDMVMCGLFTALIAAGAFIKIPVPVVPFTLQFLFTTLAGLIMGGRLGAVSVGIYAVLGLIGLPVFAEGGGIWYVLKPSFGYILGFIAASFVTGKMAEYYMRDNKTLTVKKLLAANFTGLAIVYLVGITYYYFICNFVINAPIGFAPLMMYCFVLAVPGDIILCFLAAFLTKRMKPIYVKMRGV